MKRLAWRVLLFLLTFSVGVAVNGILLSEKHVEPTRIVQTAEPVVKVVQIPVPQPAPSPEPQIILDYDVSKVEHNGYFEIVGKKPRQFRVFVSFGVEIYPTTEGGVQKSITVMTADGEKYDYQPAVFALLTSRRLFFISAPFASGFAYRFEGQFLHTNLQDERIGKNSAVIAGRLIKSKNGRTVAKAAVKFRLVLDEC